jgi:hypothetical protein
VKTKLVPTFFWLESEGSGSPLLSPNFQPYRKVIDQSFQVYIDQVFGRALFVQFVLVNLSKNEDLPDLPPK